MPGLSDFQGVYAGELLVAQVTYHLTLRISIHEANDGITSYQFEDAISGDIYASQEGIRDKLPYSFRCEIGRV